MRRRRNRAKLFDKRLSLTELGKLVVPEYAARLHWYHLLIAEALEGLLRFVHYRGKRGGYARVAISMPARHGKSLHGVELFPALGLGLYPDMKFMVATNTGTLAKKSVRNTGSYMSEPAYMGRYGTRIGRVQTIEGKDDSGVVDVEKSAFMMRTIRKDPTTGLYRPAAGYYKAAGVGGSLVGEGFDIGILDDVIKNAQQALSDTHLKNLWDFYTSVFDQRGDHPWAGQLIVGHRWTKPDFVDELVSYWESASTPDHPLPVKVIRLAAIAEAPLEPYDPREIGEGLNKPEVSPPAWYQGKKAQLMSQRPWVWHGMWQQNPSFDGSKFFGAYDWSWYGRTFELAQRLVVVDFSIDAAMSEAGQSFTVIQVTGFLLAGSGVGRDAGEHFFWLEERRGHFSHDQIYEQFESAWIKWSTALPAQFDEATIMDACPQLYESTVAKDAHGRILTDANGDVTCHHAKPRIWCENKALGASFIARYNSPEKLTPGVNTLLNEEQIAAVARALYPVGKSSDKIFCYRQAQQVVSLSRVWMPRESFGEDLSQPFDLTTNKPLPLVDASPLGVVWEQDEATGEWKRYKGDDYKLGVIHELDSSPSKPDDRRDTMAMEIICRTPWLGPHILAQRA